MSSYTGMTIDWSAVSISTLGQFSGSLLYNSQLELDMSSISINENLQFSGNANAINGDSWAFTNIVINSNELTGCIITITNNKLCFSETQISKN